MFVFEGLNFNFFFRFYLRGGDGEDRRIVRVFSRMFFVRVLGFYLGRFSKRVWCLGIFFGGIAVIFRISIFFWRGRVGRSRAG